MNLSNFLKRKLFWFNALYLVFFLSLLFSAYAVYNYVKSPELERVETAQETPEQFLVQPGTYTTSKIFVANLATSGSPAPATMTLYSTTGATQQLTFPNIYPGGVSMITDSGIPAGLFSGVIQSSAPVAAVSLSSNLTAKTADNYTGSTLSSNTLYGLSIFNKHSNWESIIYCQNTGTQTSSIEAYLYKTGEANYKVKLSQSVAPNRLVKWDIADDSLVQGPWPGGNGQFGYAKFTSTQSIACVVDSQRMISPYVQSQYSAVPYTYAGTTLYVSGVFNGHGISSTNNKGYKWNTGINIVNTNSSSTSVTVVYTSGTYVKSCTKSVAASGSINWIAAQVGTAGDGWSCNPAGTIPWPGPTLGSAKITSTLPVLAIASSQRYDSGANLGAGYVSIASSPSLGKAKIVCPLTFNKNPSNDWLTGVVVVNMGSTAQTVNWTMVRANVDPNGSGNKKTITRSIPAGQAVSVSFAQLPAEALQNFEGAVFVQANDTSAKLAASASNTNYNTLGAASMYDCQNY